MADLHSLKLWRMGQYIYIYIFFFFFVFTLSPIVRCYQLGFDFDSTIVQPYKNIANSSVHSNNVDFSISWSYVYFLIRKYWILEISEGVDYRSISCPLAWFFKRVETPFKFCHIDLLQCCSINVCLLLPFNVSQACLFDHLPGFSSFPFQCTSQFHVYVLQERTRDWRAFV
jgi:hypothetical protein